MNEEAVFTQTRRILNSLRWEIVGGQPPGGSHNIPVIEIKDPDRVGKGSKGAFKPDIVAYRDGTWILVEAKPRYSNSDRLKLLGIIAHSNRLRELANELHQRGLLHLRIRPTLSNVLGVLAYCGTFYQTELETIVVDNLFVSAALL